MKKVKWHLETGFAGCIHEGEFGVVGEFTDDELEDLAKDVAFSKIDWGWEVEEC